MKLKERYNKEIVPDLEDKFGYKNIMAVPKIDKVVLNVGVSSNKKDEKYLELIESNLMRISGQRPVKTLARKAISGFKIREGNVVGFKVTLRGNRMYDFLEKLIKISLPRVRDFRGIKLSAVDKNGNLNIGFKEHVSFAEIDSSEVERLHGLEVNVSTTTNNRDQALELFKLMGFPFKKDNK